VLLQHAIFSDLVPQFHRFNDRTFDAHVQVRNTGTAGGVQTQLFHSPGFRPGPRGALVRDRGEHGTGGHIRV